MSERTWGVSSAAGDPLEDPRTLASIMRGHWVSEPATRGACGAAIDSRAVRAGQAFFALPGTRTDGHAHVGEALARGAACAIVRDDAAIAGDAQGPILRVPGVMDAMEALARARRLRMRARVVGVTGSSGKTTTTRLVAGVLAQRGRTSASERSHNNTLGTCLTVLNAAFDAEFLVAEVGMNAAGEIARLADLLRPDVGVITSIGRAHLEGLGSLRAIAREKASLLDGLGESDLAIIPEGDSPGLGLLDEELRTRARILRVGMSPRADVRVERIRPMRDGAIACVIGGCAYVVPLRGAHNAMNAALGVALGRELGLDEAAIARGLLQVRAPEMRLHRREVGSVVVLDDSYNANPESMAAAIETMLGEEWSGRRVVALGDMLELGEAHEDAHREIGEMLALQSGIGLALLVGRGMTHAADVLRRAGVEVIFEASADDRVFDRLAGALRPGDLVLLKGSRGMRMERLIGAIGRACGVVACARATEGAGA